MAVCMSMYVRECVCVSGEQSHANGTSRSKKYAMLRGVCDLGREGDARGK